jgi:opacity protein-like surface antigen
MLGRRIWLSAAIALTIACCITPPRAEAQAEWAIRAGVGKSLMDGRLGYYWGNGVPITLGLHYSLSQKFAMGVEFSYQSLNLPRAITIDDTLFYDAESKLEIYRIGFGAKRYLMSPDSRVRPYLALGVGVYPISISSEDSAGVQIRSIAATGISPGAGVDYKVGPAFGVSLEGRYHLVGGSQAEIGYKSVNYVEISIGFKFVPGEE